MVPLGTESAPGPSAQGPKKDKRVFHQDAEKGKPGTREVPSPTTKAVYKLKPTFCLTTGLSGKPVSPLSLCVSQLPGLQCSKKYSASSVTWERESADCESFHSLLPAAELTALQNPDISAALARLGVQEDECGKPLTRTSSSLQAFWDEKEGRRKGGH